MATEQGLRLLLTADVNEFERAMRDAKKATENAAAGIVAAGKQIAGAGNYLESLQHDLRSLVAGMKDGTARFVGFSKPIPQANDNLQDFARQTGAANSSVLAFNNIIRDSPFGIVGVGNNITQLVDSFRALQVQTGSTTGALSAMAAGIFSPAGLLTIGLSAAVTLFTVISMRMQSTKKDTEELKDETKSFADIQKEANEQTAGTVERLNVLASVVTDTNKSYKERTAALKQLREENQNYFSDLSLEKSSLEDVTKAVNDYSDAITNQAIIKGLQESLSKTAAEVAKLTPKVSAQAKQFFDAVSQPSPDTVQKSQRTIGQMYQAITQSIVTGNRQVATDIGAGLSIDQAAQNAIAPLEDALKRVTELRRQLTDAIQQSLNQKPLDGEQIKSESDKAIKGFSDLNEVATKTILTFSRFPELFKTFGISGLTSISNDVVTATQTIDTALSGYNRIASERLSEGIKIVEEKGAELKIAYDGLITGAVDAIGSAIGSGSLKDAIAGFANILGNWLQSLGQQLVVYSGVLKGLIIAIEGLNPTAAAVAGFLAIAAGAALKSYASKIPSFATGGIVTQPTLAMVGDNPGRKEAIIPSELWPFLGGGNQVFIPDARISGTDIVIAYKRAVGAEGRIR